MQPDPTTVAEAEAMFRNGDHATAAGLLAPLAGPDSTDAKTIRLLGQPQLDQPV